MGGGGAVFIETILYINEPITHGGNAIFGKYT